MDWSLGNRELTDGEFRVQLFAIATLVLSLGLLFPVPAHADEAVADPAPVEVVPAPAEEPVLVPAQPSEEPLALYDADGSLVFSEQAPDVSLAAASPSSVYGSVAGGTYVELAVNLLPRVGWGEDYVFFRSGQYSYSLVWGALDLSGTSFTGDDLERVDFVNSNYGYTFSHTEGSSINLDAGDYIVYSSLGNYPVLAVEPIILSFLMYCSVGAVSLFVLHTLFSFSIRLGVRTVEGASS